MSAYEELMNTNPQGKRVSGADDNKPEKRNKSNLLSVNVQPAAGTENQIGGMIGASTPSSTPVVTEDSEGVKDAVDAQKSGNYTTPNVDKQDSENKTILPKRPKPIYASDLGDEKYKTPVDAYKEYLSGLEKEERNANDPEEIKRKRKKTIASAVIDGIGALGNVIATANGATAAAPSTFSARANAKNKEDEEKHQKRRDAISSAKIALGKAREESMYKGLENARKARAAALSDWYTQVRGNATMQDMARDEEMHELNKLLTDKKITKADYDAEKARIDAKYAEATSKARIGSYNRSNQNKPKQTYSFLGKNYDSLHDLQRDVYAYASENDEIETEDKNLFEIIAAIEKLEKNSN